FHVAAVADFAADSGAAAFHLYLSGRRQCAGATDPKAGFRDIQNSDDINLVGLALDSHNTWLHHWVASITSFQQVLLFQYRRYSPAGGTAYSSELRLLGV